MDISDILSTIFFLVSCTALLQSLLNLEHWMISAPNQWPWLACMLTDNGEPTLLKIERGLPNPYLVLRKNIGLLFDLG